MESSRGDVSEFLLLWMRVPFDRLERVPNGVGYLSMGWMMIVVVASRHRHFADCRMIYS